MGQIDRAVAKLRRMRRNGWIHRLFLIGDKLLNRRLLPAVQNDSGAGVWRRSFGLDAWLDLHRSFRRDDGRNFA